MKKKLRFAPSPTGYLHVGNIRTALMNFLLAQTLDADFYLRLDDTDKDRSKEEYIQAIHEDLKWLGITYHDSFKQSERLKRYDSVRDHLIETGYLYPCYETSDELERKRKKLRARGKPPIYDRAALSLTEEEKKSFEDQGRKPHWRFKLDDTVMTFQDMIRSQVSIQANSVSDPVLIRADGSYLYTLCSVIDDADYGITHIIRGEDHVTNTAVQMQIFKVLGAHMPTFGHHPLLTDQNGEKLSKRIGALSVRSMREQGLEPLAILSYLSRLGTSDPIVPFTTHHALSNGFDINSTSQSAARFSEKDMAQLNMPILASYDFDVISPRLAPDKMIDRSIWDGIKFNIEYFNDYTQWVDIIHLTPDVDDFSQEDQAYLKQAIETAERLEWSDNAWKDWTTQLKEITGRKGKALFMPLRIALTGMDHGPEMAIVISLLGKEKILQRLRNTSRSNK